MNIVITGASGFIGEAICKKFTAINNINVLAVNRSSSNNLSNIKQAIVEDINANTNWGHIIKNSDAIIHLASLAHSYKYSHFKTKRIYADLNYRGTINLFKQSIKKNVKRFIFISTIKVNGDFNYQDLPFKFNDLPYPQSIYSITKLKTENELIKLSKGHSIELLILRPTLIYGNKIKGNLIKIMKK